MPKAKKSKKKKMSGNIVEPQSYSESRSVQIKKASNGYVVSTYSGHGEKIVIAKTKKEAKKAASGMMDI